jgi:uncharacterized protein (DUF58 family)
MSRAPQLAAAGAILCAVAAAFAAPELYVPGVSLLLVALAAPLWVGVAARGVRLWLHAPEGVVQEGERVTVRFGVRRGACPLPGGTLELVSPPQPLALPGRHDGGASTTSLPMYRRGRHRVGPLRLTVRDPFGLASREIVSAASEVLVLPRVHPMSAEATGGLDGGAQRRALAPRAASEIDSLRPYRPGAPASRIHWPTVARTGELIEHRLVADAERRPLIVLDATAPQSPDSLDRAVRAAASLCVHLARRGGCGLLLPGDRRSVGIEPDLRGWPAQHARLALVEATDVPPAAARGQLADNASMLVYVSAALPGAAAPPIGCCRVSPHPMPGLPVAFSVAGCDAQIVPALMAVQSA